MMINASAVASSQSRSNDVGVLWSSISNSDVSQDSESDEGSERHGRELLRTTSATASVLSLVVNEIECFDDIGPRVERLWISTPPNVVFSSTVGVASASFQYFFYGVVVIIRRLGNFLKFLFIKPSFYRLLGCIDDRISD